MPYDTLLATRIRLALGLTLVMRGRDMLIGSLGLLLAGTGWKRKAK